MMLCEIFHCRWRQLVLSAVGAVVEQGENQEYVIAAKVGKVLARVAAGIIPSDWPTICMC